MPCVTVGVGPVPDRIDVVARHSRQCPPYGSDEKHRVAPWPSPLGKANGWSVYGERGLLVL